MKRPVRQEIERGPFPYDDGWGWLYRAVDRLAPAGSDRRGVLCRYFFPNGVERWRTGKAYRLLGVHWFGSVIPTGGIVWRRVTKARMAPYTLAAISIGGARAFYYRTCVFEALHFPFLLAMVFLAGLRAAEGRWDLAVENTAINLVMNVYPIMHHRRTRTRIVQLLARSGCSRRGG
jgi:hypothetical protein